MNENKKLIAAVCQPETHTVKAVPDQNRIEEESKDSKPPSEMQFDSEPQPSQQQLEEEEKEGNLCEICYCTQIQMALEPCLHSFCHECIYKWTREHDTCPLCRQKCEPHVTPEQREREARDALLAELTTVMRRVLDDEKKRLMANIRLR